MVKKKVDHFLLEYHIKMIILKTKNQIKKIKKSCRIVASVLSVLKNIVEPGITTEYLNNVAERMCLDAGVTPAFKGYRGFPYAICASVNEEIVHGFPSKASLQEGDILSVDFGVIRDGWFGDSAFTTAVGSVSKEAEKLIRITKEGLYAGIKQAIPGNRLGDIGYAIQKRAVWSGHSVVKDFVGHGIGRNLHEDPQVLNYGQQGKGIALKVGTVIAIEPMFTTGSAEIHTLPDQWTTITKDHSLSAHWEHTIAILEDGPEILTIRD